MFRQRYWHLAQSFRPVGAHFASGLETLFWIVHHVICDCYSSYLR